VWINTTAGMNGDAWLESNEDVYPMAKSQQRAFERHISRLLLYLVMSRNQPTFICSHIGQTEFNGKPVEQIATAINGMTCTLMIDPTTAHIVGQTYRARGPSGLIGEYEIAYSDHQAFDGITLPITWSTKVNGDYIAEYSGTLDEVHFNREIDEQMFKMPKGK
jgi:hypothetical protein